MPDRLAGRRLQLDARTAADVADAELAIAELNRDVRALADSEAIARLLLRAEAVASSKIEGLEVGGRRLLKAQLARQIDEARADVTAIEVLNNVEAMSWAVDQLSDRPRLTVDDLLAVHERLLAGTRLEQHGGPSARGPELDRRQRLQPVRRGVRPASARARRRAARGPVRVLQRRRPPGRRPSGDRARAVRDDPPVRRRQRPHGTGADPRGPPPARARADVRAADLARPGHLGRRLRRGAHPHALRRPARRSPTRTTGLNDWIAFFAGACRRAVADAQRYEQRVAELQQTWRAPLGSRAARLRGRPAARRPARRTVLTVQSAAALIDRSAQATNEAIARLVEGGVLAQTTSARNRAFEAPELIDAFTALERQLASPDADTRTSPPARRVPSRRAR